MNVLVLGGSGYLGSRIINNLVNKGYYVVCANSHGENIVENLCSVFEKITVISSEVSSVNDYLSSYTVDWILNFAGIYEKKGIKRSSIVNCNTIFGLQMLDLAIEHNVKNFLTIDTSLPDNFNLYSFTKKRFADFGRFYCSKYNYNFINLVLEMFYGPEEPQNRFFPMCIEKLQNNEVLELTKGTQKRDIIHIDDVCGAIIAIINSNLRGFQEIPVGTGEGPSVREIVEYMHSIIKSTSLLKFGSIPIRNNEPDSIADTSILKSIGFNCTYNWKTGLKQLINNNTV